LFRSQVPDLAWPTNYRYPDDTYRDEMSLEVGGVLFELHHDRGETDDHTWTWIPEHRVLCCGDFFIWASPNAGNPQKVQRYPSEWAAALRKMAGLGPEVLLPGHGFPIVGADRVAARARQLADAGDLRLAGHLAELAALAAPENPEVQRARAEVFEGRVAEEASIMSRGIFAWAAGESRRQTNG